MIQKTDKRFFRLDRKYERGYMPNPLRQVCVRRETWWLFGFLPLYFRDTVL